MRIVETKKNSSQPLTPAELQFTELYENRSFRVPEPLSLFVEFWHAQLAGYGGYYTDEIYGVANHNLYEEIPAPGVVAEAWRMSVSDHGAGHYQTALSPFEGAQANLNLLGYAPLTNRRSEAKNIFLANGITADVFPEDIPGTAINFALIDAVSEVLGGVSAFKMHDIIIS
ncbi:unnamed protein product [Echinostoma caproni]|uniref:RES domain-containing protein n=1 Tax=Echinostoma caproni TaxID=27848 RepID=A0A183BE13_9TREM|nr:unnamed protein product [Echinostoma caproni]